MTKATKEFSLREKKSAKTKIALLNEFTARLKRTKFADISIKEICDAAEVSEATFYNYFPQKKDVLFFYEALMGLRVNWVIVHQLKNLSPVEVINEVFTIISSDIEDRNMFNEFVTVMIAEDDKHCMKNFEISPAEKHFAYPDLPGIEDIQVMDLETTLLEQLNQAKEQGLLKDNVVLEQALIALFSIMVGAPLCLDKEAYPRFKDHYQTQLSWFWRAVGAGGPEA